MGKKGKKAAAAPAVETRPVAQRGTEYEAQKLTGARAQRGNLPGGAPRFTYEVLWKGGAKTYEPADCLVGWEAEMANAKVDEAARLRALAPQINPFAEAQKQRIVLLFWATSTVLTTLTTLAVVNSKQR